MMGGKDVWASPTRFSIHLLPFANFLSLLRVHLGKIANRMVKSITHSHIHSLLSLHGCLHDGVVSLEGIHVVAIGWEHFLLDTLAQAIFCDGGDNFRQCRRSTRYSGVKSPHVLRWLYSISYLVHQGCQEGTCFYGSLIALFDELWLFFQGIRNLDVSQWVSWYGENIIELRRNNLIRDNNKSGPKFILCYFPVRPDFAFWPFLETWLCDRDSGPNHFQICVSIVYQLYMIVFANQQDQISWIQM